MVGNVLFVHAGLLPDVAEEINGDIQFLNKIALRYFKYGEEIGSYSTLWKVVTGRGNLGIIRIKRSYLFSNKKTLNIISNSVDEVDIMVIGHNTKHSVRIWLWWVELCILIPVFMQEVKKVWHWDHFWVEQLDTEWLNCWRWLQDKIHKITITQWKQPKLMKQV